MKHHIRFSLPGLLLFLYLFSSLEAQEKPRLYNPQADARQDINRAVSLAASQHKHVLIQIGGNWCPWCIRLHDFYTHDHEIDSIMQADYVTVLVNYSQENRNAAVLASLGYPQRFGFPVLVVLDGKGERLHTQNTAFLEEDKGYSAKKVREFLLGWNPRALDPSQYKE